MTTNIDTRDDPMGGSSMKPPEGLTIRDQFAIAAIGPIVDSMIASSETIEPTGLASLAYSIADALMKARGQ